MKRWKINSADKRLAADFKGQCDIGLLALKLLTARGCTEFSDVVAFFKSQELEDPFAIADMQKAAEAITEAVDAGEIICVYGDYDCDGVTATYVLYTFLQNIGADVRYYINEREQGYGINVDAVRKLHEEGVQMIVTVDNGISAVPEAEECKRLGMKLVVTDHHQPPDPLPDAIAVVDPHRHDCPSAYKDLAGVGVALKLCAALDDGNYDMVIEQYADIVAIGTVGDLVPLTGENRTLTRTGLMYLKNTENPGLNELMEKAAVDRGKLNSGTLAFQVCPRINAAGRFASPLIALETLLTDDPEQAAELAGQLVDLNEQRKKTEKDIYFEIQNYIDRHPEVLDKRVLVLSGLDWHHGVIGIVSSKVLEDYGKPNVIISVESGSNAARGSARSLKGFNIHECFTYCGDLLEKYGGHECAGGLSLKFENLEAFEQRVQEFAAKFDKMPAAENECDMELEAEDLTIENVRSITQLQPFGVSNPTPLFYMPACRVDKITALKGGKHTKLDITYKGSRFQALMFSISPRELFFSEGAAVDLAVNVDINEFNGRESVSIKVKDVKPAGLDPERYLAARDAYEKLMNGVPLPKNFIAKMKPSRKELIYIYKYMQQYTTLTIDSLFMRLNHPVFNYCKLRLIARIFTEAGLAEFTPAKQLLTLLPVTQKADLEATETMKYLEAAALR